MQMFVHNRALLGRIQTQLTAVEMKPKWASEAVTTVAAVAVRVASVSAYHARFHSTAAA